MACICTRGQVGENVRHVLQLGPVELQVLPRGEVAEAAIVVARDVGELAQLARAQQAIRNRDAQHRRMALDVEAVAQSQRAKLILGQLAGEEAPRLIAEFRHALVDHRLVDVVVAIHGWTIGAGRRPLPIAARLVCRSGGYERSPGYPTKTVQNYAGRSEGHMPGLYFEQFEVGQRFEHAVRRTVTETDNVLFSTLTMNPAALHLDDEYCKGTPFGKPLVNSLFTLGLMIGLSVEDTTIGTTLGNLGWEEVKFPKPVFLGDTLRIETTVLAMRESQSRKESGIVTFEHRAFNQRNEEVASCRRAALMMKRPAP